MIDSRYLLRRVISCSSFFLALILMFKFGREAERYVIGICFFIMFGNNWLLPKVDQFGRRRQEDLPKVGNAKMVDVVSVVILMSLLVYLLMS